MLGNITIDKASMVLSYFLYSVWLIKDCGGRMSRPEFEKKMASFIGVSIKNEDGTINRTPYNKSKFPRYFGFICSEYGSESEEEFLVLTFRGQELSTIIGQKQDANIFERYYITDKNKFKSLILYSLLFDSFGKNNYGAEQSNTDVEPPKVVFKAISELGYATSKEIFYVLFGINGYPKKSKAPLFESFEKAIIDVKEKRILGYDYSSWVKTWDLQNFVNDCKVVKIFTEKGFDLISSKQNEITGELEYFLSDDLSDEEMKMVRLIRPIYQPVLHVQKSEGNLSFIQQWMNIAIYGREYCNDMIYRIKASEIQDDLFENDTFCNALISAYKNSKKEIYLEFESLDLDEIIALFGGENGLLDRIVDTQDEFNGWSVKGTLCTRLHDRIMKEIPSKINGIRINDILPLGMVRLPSNFNVTGVKSHGN